MPPRDRTPDARASAQPIDPRPSPGAPLPDARGLVFSVRHTARTEAVAGELLRAHAAAEGHRPCRPAAPRSYSLAAALSSAADQVAALGAEGYAASEIGKILDLAPATVVAWLRLRSGCATESRPDVFNRILAAVALEAGLEREAVLSRARQRPIVQARQEIMARCASEGMSERAIAGALRLDASTVRHGIDQARRRSAESPCGKLSAVFDSEKAAETRAARRR